MKNPSTYKKDVLRWYETFNRKDPSLLKDLLSESWVDIPPAPNQPPGLDGVKQTLEELTTTFPDFKVEVQDVLQEGNKVIVRSKLLGTQKGSFIGFPAKGRQLSIQAIDIHEFADGKIVRTWHSEDWMSGFHQLGVFDK